MSLVYLPEKRIRKLCQERMIFSFKSNEENNYERFISFRHLKIVQAVIPFSFYLFNSFNNAITFNDGLLDYTVNITAGNYTITNILTAIQTALNSSASILVNFVVTYDFVTGKLVITNSLATNFDLKFTNESFICDIIGFNREIKTGAISYTADNILNLQPYNFIGLKIPGFEPNTLQSFNFYSLYGQSLSENFIAIFPINNNVFGTNIIYNDEDNYVNEVYSDKIYRSKKINFQLYLIGSNSLLISQNGCTNSILCEIDEKRFKK